MIGPLRTHTVALVAAALIAAVGTTQPVDRAAAASKPALEVTTKVIGTPSPGRAATVRVTVTNRTARRATGIVVRVAAPPTAHRLATRLVRIALLRARRAKTVVVRVTPLRAAALMTPVVVTATAPEFRVASTRVVLARQAGASADPYAGHAFTHFNPGVTGLVQPSYDAIVFTGGGWAHWGVPEGGIPVCAARTGAVVVGGGTHGCVPYTYDATRGTLTVDGQPISLSATGKGEPVLSLGSTSFTEVPLVPKGARYDQTLSHILVYGLFPNQVISTTWLSFASDGRFIRSGLTLGSTFDSNFSSIPPDQRGTYEFTENGQLTLNYEDGTVVRLTATGAWMPDPGQTYTPAVQWMVLNGVLYGGEL